MRNAAARSQRSCHSGSSAWLTSLSALIRFFHAIPPAGQDWHVATGLAKTHAPPILGPACGERRRDLGAERWLTGHEAALEESSADGESVDTEYIELPHLLGRVHGARDDQLAEERLAGGAHEIEGRRGN